jgi:2-hydroxy-6-oxonona-2,4-dienedioate hydrolase
MVVRILTLRIVLRRTVIALVALTIAVAAVHLRQMQRAYDRDNGGGKILATPFGRIQFAEHGSGPAVLVIHGSGGGYDQGALIANTVIGDNFHWLAPSRFGYLGSTLPVGATFESQADAYAHLLDHLGIERTSIVALSQGGPSALFFAIKYPERVDSIVLISCGVAASFDAKQAQANRSGDMLKTIFKYNFIYWTVSTALRKQLMNLMGANNEVIAKLNAQQLQIIDQIIDLMNPVAPRFAGVDLDNRAMMPNEKIAAIRAPTLIFHAVDDTLQLYRNAEFAAATIAGSRLRRFASGGHLILAIEQPLIQTEIRDFILTNVSDRSR